MRKRLAKIGLWALSAVVPVFIAACYGVATFCKSGRVVDKATGLGINGIQVSCLVTNGPAEFSIDEDVTATEQDDGYCGSGDMDVDADTDTDTGFAIDPGASDAPADLLREVFSLPGDGFFQFASEEPISCELLRFTDVDGAANGAYEELTLWDDQFDGVARLRPVE